MQIVSHGTQPRDRHIPQCRPRENGWYPSHRWHLGGGCGKGVSFWLYKGVKVKLYGKDACHCASPASSGPIAQDRSSYSRFSGIQPLYDVEGSWKQDDLLLNDREAVPMCHDDDVSNDSHFPNQVDYWPKNEIKDYPFLPGALKSLKRGLNKKQPWDLDDIQVSEYRILF